MKFHFGMVPFLGDMLNFTGVPPEICGNDFQLKEEKMMLDNFTRCWWSKTPRKSATKRPTKNRSGHETFRRRFFSRTWVWGRHFCWTPWKFHWSSSDQGFDPTRKTLGDLIFGSLEISGKKNQDQLHLVPFLHFLGDFFWKKIVANASFLLAVGWWKYPSNWSFIAQPNCSTCRSTSNGTRTNARRSARRNWRATRMEDGKELAKGETCHFGDVFFPSWLSSCLGCWGWCLNSPTQKEICIAKPVNLDMLFSISICCWRNKFLGLPTMEIQTCLLPKPEVNTNLADWIICKTPHTQKLGGGFKDFYFTPDPWVSWSNFDFRIFFRWVGGSTINHKKGC